MSIYIGTKEVNELYLGEGKTVVVSDMQGPCDDGFHVPTKDEFQGLINTLSSIGYSGYNNIKSYLKLPPAGYYSQRGSLTNKGSTMGYWTCSPNGSYSFYLECSSSYTGFYGQGRCYGATIRPFKDKFIIPDSTWIVILGTIGSSGVFRNQNDGIISVTSNGTTGYTIADKNLGATTVYDNGTATDANCGSYFQWGNNYGFPSSGITTSSSQVNASTYGPGNYYSSSTFIAYASNPYNWDNSNNTNLRGGVSQGSSSRIEPNAKEVYIGTTKVYPAKPKERIEYKMNADSSGILYVPVGGYGTSGGAGESYNRKISVDGGAETTYSGTGSSGGSITLSGYTAGSSHTIKIVPTTEAYLRARAYGWFNTSGAPHLTEIIYDSSYMGYAVSATDTGAYFRCRNYYGCTNLTKPAEEYLPDTVTTIGDQFMRNSYYGCTSLTYASEESLPSSVTSIGTYFRGYQYQGCTALTEVKGWKDLSIGNGTRYRQQQFYDCTSNKTVKVIGDVGYSSYAQNALPDNYVTSVSVPSAYLTNFKNASNYPWVGITDSKFIGY